MFLIISVSTVKWRPQDICGNSRFRRWSKPITGGRTEDEAHNFNKIVNSWYFTPQGKKFSQPFHAKTAKYILPLIHSENIGD